MQNGNFQESYYEDSFVCTAIKQNIFSFVFVHWIADLSSMKRGTMIKHINGNCI